MARKTSRSWILSALLAAFLSAGAAAQNAVVRVMPVPVNMAMPMGGAAAASMALQVNPRLLPAGLPSRGLIPALPLPDTLPTVRGYSQAVGDQVRAAAPGTSVSAPALPGSKSISAPSRASRQVPAGRSGSGLAAFVKAGQKDGSSTEARSHEAYSRLSNLFDGADQKLQAGFSDQAAVTAYTDSRQTSGRSAKTSYLAQIDGQSGTQLVESLHRITSKGHRAKGYDEARHEMFSRVDNVEKDGVRGVYSFYSETFLPGASGDGSKYRERNDENGDGYKGKEFLNAEHVWPQSYFKKRVPMRSDLHHIYPSLSHPNSMRSRLPFGYVDDSKVEYRTRSGAKMGQNQFEPPDSAKGKVARAMLYFYVRYLGYNILPSNAVHNFWDSRIKMFLDWNRQFPPTPEELERNDRVEQWQGNRNPFVDDPALADRIGAENLKMRSSRASGPYVSHEIKPQAPENTRTASAKGKKGTKKKHGRRRRRHHRH